MVHRESKGRKPLSPAAAEPLLPEVDNNSLLCVLVPVLSKSRHCVCATRGPPAHRMLQSCMTLVYGLNGEDIRIQVPNLDSSIAHRPTGLQGRRTEIHAFELSTEGGWRRASSQAFACESYTVRLLRCVLCTLCSRREDTVGCYEQCSSAAADVLRRRLVLVRTP